MSGLDSFAYKIEGTGSTLRDLAQDDNSIFEEGWSSFDSPPTGPSSLREQLAKTLPKLRLEESPDKTSQPEGKFVNPIESAAGKPIDEVVFPDDPNREKPFENSEDPDLRDGMTREQVREILGMKDYQLREGSREEALLEKYVMDGMSYQDARQKAGLPPMKLPIETYSGDTVTEEDMAERIRNRVERENRMMKDPASVLREALQKRSESGDPHWWCGTSTVTGHYLVMQDAKAKRLMLYGPNQENWKH